MEGDWLGWSLDCHLLLCDFGQENHPFCASFLLWEVPHASQLLCLFLGEDLRRPWALWTVMPVGSHSPPPPTLSFFFLFCNNFVEIIVTYHIIHLLKVYKSVVLSLFKLCNHHFDQF